MARTKECQSIKPLRSSDAVPPPLLTPDSSVVHAPWKHFEAPLTAALSIRNHTAINRLLNNTNLCPLAALEGFTFSPVGQQYTRNLLLRNESFALMALVWNPGAASRIHAHAGSGCWVRLLTGALEEVTYSVLPHRLEVIQKQKLIMGKGSYVDDDIGVHRMYNSTSDVSISLHFYAPAFAECDIYEQGEKSVVVSSSATRFHMEFGKVPI